MAYHLPDHGVVFGGDTLFQGSMGRTDFEGCSHDELLKSLRKKLLSLPEETMVYPGHGPVTTIGAEKAGNPFLQELQ
jgi:glyoxylase-like metal-dependent hydrolase (beta-lactamase superfamily II)